MRLYEVIKWPLVTEKSTRLNTDATIRGEKWAAYLVEVHPSATKIDIKKAIKEIYGMEVEGVNISYTREKFRQGRKKLTMRKKWIKKAYITLKDSSAKIDFTLWIL